MTNLVLNNKNVIKTVETGRKRWKIENEGFNIQKNGTFNIVKMLQQLKFIIY